MMKVYKYKDLTEKEFHQLISRPSQDLKSVEETVLGVIHDVELNGDEAIYRYTLQWDDVAIDRTEVDSDEWARGAAAVSSEDWVAIRKAAYNIEAFHQPQFPQPLAIETAPGIYCRREWRPIHRVGLYVPGGTAPLVSTVLMLGIPAHLAGCSEVYLCSPPNWDCSIAPAMLAAAKVAGIQRIFKVGGAQAIAAMAVGTQSIPRVDKIFGPGNRFVAAAKSVVSRPPYTVGIDLTAGPSELLMVADDSVDPAWIAADLLTQTEHGSDSQVVFVSTSSDLIAEVQHQLLIQIENLPRRSLALNSLEHSFAVVVSDFFEAIEFANLYAPEHLMLSVRNPEQYTTFIRNAGSVFLGPLTTVVFGDYASGTNHTLPTGGTARHSGGLTIESFMKPISFQTVTQHAITPLVETVTRLARTEGLEAHARAAALRASSTAVSSESLPNALEYFIRQHLRDFRPYSSARSESIHGQIFLDANELSFGSSVPDEDVSLNRYPDPFQTELRSRIAEHIGVPKNSLFTGNGSDEVIDLLVRLFCEPNKDAVAILEPTYGVYEVAASIQSAPIVRIPLNDQFQIDIEKTLKATDSSTRLLFCCSPNNPTGNLLNKHSILELASLLRNTVVVLDEAYVEFAGTNSLATQAALASNFVVLRTFSKAWGLAGIRLGYCVASPSIIEALTKIKAPYNVNALTIQAALKALNRTEFADSAVQSVISERVRVVDALSTLPCVVYVYPSNANFLLVRFRDAEAAYQRLLSWGIVVRRRSEERLKNCLRITVGTPDENNAVICVLSELS